MFKNYIKTALRNIKQHTLFSLLNTTGLAIGIACCILVALFIQNEMTYDDFHENAGTIYRVNSVFSVKGGIHRQAVTQAPLGPAMKADLPEIKAAARFLKWNSVVKYQDTIFKENLTYTDPDIFSMFSFHLLQGNPEKVLNEKTSVVISEEIAQKYFGESDPFGKNIAIEIDGAYENFVVSGIVENIPENSSITFDILISFEKLKDFVRESYFSGWGSFTLRTFVQLNDAVSNETVTAKLPSFIEKYVTDSRAEYELQPLKSIHFGYNVEAGMSESTNILYSGILGGIAFLILFIACVNFMNISVAQSAIRQKEIGMRKVVGASRGQLMGQFWIEALIMSAIACAIGLVFAEIALPGFSLITGKSLSIDYFEGINFFLGMLALIMIAGTLSGTYPAFILSKFRAVETLNNVKKMSSKNGFTTALVVFQFAISIVLIIATIVIVQQINFMKTRNPGFDSEQIVVLPTGNMGGQVRFNRLKNRLSQQSGIISIAGANCFPGSGFNGTGVQTRDESHDVNIGRVDYNFLKLFDMKLKHGRGFSKEISSDNKNAVIINESLFKDLGWNSIEEKELTVNWGGVTKARVIGVVENFNFTSMHHEIENLVFYVNPEINLDYMFLKIKAGSIPATLSSVRETWKTFAPGEPFEYFFLQDEFNKLYKTEEQWSMMLRYSSLLAICIACFGVFGLSALLITRRTKEIGIRKVLGSTTPGLVALLLKTFTKWVIIANVIAWPAAWYGLHKWLQNFAYHINLTVWPFVFAGIMAFVIALITLSFQAVKAAGANPVEALKYE